MIPKFIIIISLSTGTLMALPMLTAELIPTAKPVVKISLPRVLEILGQMRESERQTEVPSTILLYTIDDRLEKIMYQLKASIKDYETQEKVRVDISAFEEDTPDYTDDFLEKMTILEDNNE